MNKSNKKVKTIILMLWHSSRYKNIARIHLFLRVADTLKGPFTWTDGNRVNDILGKWGCFCANEGVHMGRQWQTNQEWVACNLVSVHMINDDSDVVVAPCEWAFR